MAADVLFILKNRNGWALVGERKRSDNYLTVSQ
jgi:hypothetical protein